MSEGEAAGLVQAWQESGIPLRAWCAREGIDGRSMRYWLDRQSRGPTLHLIEVTPRRAPARPRSAVRVVLGDVAVVVADDFVEDTLARVLRVVRAC